jgi:hypothetical protein
MSNQDNKPFSKGYVLRTTVKHMIKDVDISIKKTMDRVAEFEGNHEKSLEVLNTLSVLHTMKTLVEDFQSHNNQLFQGE